MNLQRGHSWKTKIFQFLIFDVVQCIICLLQLDAKDFCISNRHIGSKGEAKCRRSIAWSVAWFSVRMMDGLLTREEKGKHRIPFSNNHYSR
ncbi:hypothetical protein V6Z11_A13G050300 [Gossypium hirsutum]